MACVIARTFVLCATIKLNLSQCAFVFYVVANSVSDNELSEQQYLCIADLVTRGCHTFADRHFSPACTEAQGRREGALAAVT